MIDLNHIKDDIKKLNKKDLDINNIKEEKDDLTFFNIDNEELNETLTILKKTYVTSINKEATIIKLENKLYKNQQNPKINKRDSYKLYNESINMINNNCITSAYQTLKEAKQINPKDTDILNLTGLLSLLKCNFDEAFENFYRSLCYSQSEIAQKYVQILASEEFTVFLERYNHAVRFINENLLEEATQIFIHITHEYSDLIEPYVLLYLLSQKEANTQKSKEYLDKIRDIDKDNEIFEKEEQNSNEIQEKEKEEEIKKKSKKGGKYGFIVAGLLVVILAGQYVYSSNKTKKLNAQLTKKEKELKQSKDTIKKINEEKDKHEETAKDYAQKLDENGKQITSETDLMSHASDLRKDNKLDEAIKVYKTVVDSGQTAKNKSYAMYQVALLSEKNKDYQTAEEYYKKYVNTYPRDYEYFDESYYNLGMMYYNNKDLDKAKQTFYSLRYEVPDSMYNNSAVDNILKEK